MNMNSITENVYDIANNMENSILFWTLIVTIISLIITVIISIISNNQNAKLNSINLLKESIGEKFKEFLIGDLCENIADCCCRAITDEKNILIGFSFDEIPLIKVQNKITRFLGDVAFFKYALPKKYSRLNKLGQNVISYIDDEMLPIAIFENQHNKIRYDKKDILKKRKAKKIHRRFLRRMRKFYKKAFKIYKYGI